MVLHVTIGHDEAAIIGNVRRHLPHARIVGCTCGGVIGREGANENMRALALMLVCGAPGEIDVAVAPRLDGSNSLAAGRELAQALVARSGQPTFVMFLGSGIDIACDHVIAGLESVLGPDTTIFGGTSADNMRGITSYQFIDDAVHDHAAALVGFYDPTLTVTTRASHGFQPSGVEVTVTESDGNDVMALDGTPAWSCLTWNLGLPASSTPGETIPVGAVGIALPPEVAAEYGDSHLLRAITRKTPGGGFLMPVTCPVGTRLALMQRDEERIFANLTVILPHPSGPQTLPEQRGSQAIPLT